MIKAAIAKVVGGRSLTTAEARGVFSEIMSGKATAAQIAGFITALRVKGETVEEITGAAMVMRQRAIKLKARSAGKAVDTERERIVDTCGTGGSGTNTFNISTTAAFVVAGCGIKVAKHGNRGVSSACGSADVIKALGVNIDIPPKKVEKCIRRIGIGFLYAPLFHGAMKYAVGPRREIGIRTIFNILGPLTNPAGADAQVLGVYDEKLTGVLARVLNNLGTKRALVVHGLDALDEITITGKTKISELNNQRIKTYYINPENFGIKRAGLKAIKGGTLRQNAQIVLSVLKGEKGARRDVVLLNSAAALVAAGTARNIRKGICLAAESIDSGRALEKLELLKKYTSN
jgi:anthranilate phosphoribosyltransferase